MLDDLRDHVELVARDVVAHPVAGILGEPVAAGARIDVAADAVAHAERHDLRRPGLQVDAPHLRHAARRVADVEGRTERHVDPAVLVEGQVLPAMRHVGRHVVVDDDRLRRLVEIGLDVVVAIDLVDRNDVERAISKREAGGHVEALEDCLDDLLAALVDDGIDVGRAERADEQGTLVTERHLPRLGHAAGIDADREARRQLHRLQVLRQFLVRGRKGRVGGRRQALLRRGLVAEEPVRRRVLPERLAARIVLLEGLRLGRPAGQAHRHEGRRQDLATHQGRTARSGHPAHSHVRLLPLCFSVALVGVRREAHPAVSSLRPLSSWTRPVVKGRGRS